MFLLLYFCNFTNLYLSINTIVLKLSFRYYSGKIRGGTRASLSEASKIWGDDSPRPSRTAYDSKCLKYHNLNCLYKRAVIKFRFTLNIQSALIQRKQLNIKNKF